MKAAPLILALASTAAHAQFLTGNELYERMQSTGPKLVNAQAYVMGVADSELGVEWCPPNSVTVRQVFDLTSRVLEALPERRHENASYFVSAAIRNAWPCKPKAKGSTL